MTSRLPMTSTRWVLLGAGLPLALAAIAVSTFVWVHGAVKALVKTDQVGYPVSLTAPLTNGRADVTTINADTRLTAGQGSRISVRGYLAGSIARPVFGHQQTPAGLILNPRCRAPVGSCSLSFTITVPAGAPVRARNSLGNLSAGPLRGTITLSSNAGDLSVSGLAGNLRLADVLGNIQASGMSGHTWATNNSGDIDVTGVTGDVQLTDSLGNITVDGLAAGDVHCHNQSGDITLTFTKVPKLVDVGDSTGNITLRLPPGPTRYQITTSNSSGNTSVTVPRSPTSANVITATDNSGDITIDR